MNKQLWSVASIGMRCSLYRFVTVASLMSSAPALAQSPVTLPMGENVRDRPDQIGDVVLDVDRAGGFALNGQPGAAALIATQLRTLLMPVRDRVVYIRADAQLPATMIDSVLALAVRGTACVASLVATQQPGTMSRVMGDVVQPGSDVRRAIDVQLFLMRVAADLPRPPVAGVVLEVLPGPAYRINSQAVTAEDLTKRLREIFDPRPIKVLLVVAPLAVPYQQVFHAMDAARAAGIVDIVAVPPGSMIPATLPAIDLSVRVTARDDAPAASEGNIGRCRLGDVAVSQTGRSPSLSASPPPNGSPVYFSFQVERQATRLADGVTPHYPEELRASRANGRVVAQFVVDTTGRVVPETFKVLSTTNDLFAQAVKAALPDMRFTPATVGGKPVRQLVQQPFAFTITP